jgi:hypothetical protein
MHIAKNKNKIENNVLAEVIKYSPRQEQPVVMMPNSKKSFSITTPAARI